MRDIHAFIVVLRRDCSLNLSDTSTTAKILRRPAVDSSGTFCEQ